MTKILKKAINWAKRNKLLLVVSFIFLAYQWLISFLLWHRSGDIPPGFSDTYAYIYDINKLIVHHTLFPFTFYLSFSAHFTYVGYNLFMGLLGLITGLSGSNIFYYSFFFGKVVLLFSLIYLLKNLFRTEKFLMILSLFFLGFFFGGGDIHGFFWVVPSFWMTILFFILFGIIFSEKKFSNIFLFLLAFFYITVHPISSYSVVIFIIFTIFCFFSERELFKKSLKITAFLLASVLLFQATIFVSSKYSYLFYKQSNGIQVFMPRQSIIGSNNNSGSNQVQPVQKEKVGNINMISYSLIGLKDNNPEDAVITDSIPSISFKAFNGPIARGLTSISRYFPSVIESWNSYFSWFYRLPILLPLLIFSLYTNYKKRKKLFYLYSACLLFSLISLLHPFGYRSIVFLFPITIILASTGIYDLYFIAVKFLGKGKNNNQNIAKAIYITLVIMGAGGFALYGIVCARYYSKKADYKLNVGSCLDYVKKKDKNETNFYFSGQEGINYFLSHGFDTYRLLGMDNYSEESRNAENIFVLENPAILKSEDIELPLVSKNRLNEIVDDNYNANTEKVNCGIFILYDTKEE